MAVARTFERLLHNGQLKEGKLVLDNPEWFNGMLSLYADTAVSVTVERTRHSKSREQLGYYWGVVLPELSSHTGHSIDELHEIFKSKLLRKQRVWRGQKLTTVGSTQDLSVNEMADFITNVIVEANELGIEVPPADKSYQFK